MDQHEAQVARSKARIVDAVVELIVKRGVRAVTIEEVAATSGVAKTTVYRHWPSREALVAETLAAALPAPVIPDTGSLAGDLQKLARGLAAGLGDARSAALLAAIALPDGDPSLDAVRHDATRARHQALRAVVRRARERGESVPVDGADGLIRSIAGPLFYRRFVEGVPPTRTMADRCVQRALAPAEHTEGAATGGRTR
ncbi:MAG: TetR/AcrR family transcriptional regulator [Actinobacteria bacterium]|nr:TetR/AcrR family transcriptional regulator [Actinomycetota bacterium]